MQSILFAATALATGLAVGSQLELNSSYVAEASAPEQNEVGSSILQERGTAIATQNIRGLLTFIQRFESAGAIKSQGVKSAYQVVYGGIAVADRPTVALTSMTVAEVLAWQDSIDSRYPSEAAGAYQVMEDTLRGLVKSGRIDPSALFNEEIQDAVAKLLLERRGLSKFLAGNISAEKFADNLAREWASFPVVRDQKGASRTVLRGQSYYAGDGVNKAHADPDEFLKVVKGIFVIAGNSTDRMTLANPNERKQDQGVPAQRDETENENGTGNITLGANKSLNGPLKINGKIGIADYRDWNITTSAEYEFGTDTYEINGTATYEKDNLSFSFSGATNSADGPELEAELKLNF